MVSNFPSALEIDVTSSRPTRPNIILLFNNYYNKCLGLWIMILDYEILYTLDDQELCHLVVVMASCFVSVYFSFTSIAPLHPFQPAQPQGEHEPTITCYNLIWVSHIHATTSNSLTLCLYLKSTPLVMLPITWLTQCQN